MKPGDDIARRQRDHLRLFTEVIDLAGLL